MAASPYSMSGQFPTVGTSDATSVKTVGVVGAAVVAKKGFGKSGNPSGDRKSNRRSVSETSGARYAVTETRAYPQPAEGVGRNVRLLPASHGQQDTWHSSYASFGQGDN